MQNAQRHLRVKLSELRPFSDRALQLVLQTPVRSKTQLQGLAAVTVVMITDSRMAALHRKFLNTESATDVITFQHGEIFVSVETAQRHAARFGTSTEAEIKLYIVHGLLHLHGFDDRTPAKLRLMEAAQKRIHAAALRDAGQSQGRTPLG